MEGVFARKRALLQIPSYLNGPCARANADYPKINCAGAGGTTDGRSDSDIQSALVISWSFIARQYSRTVHHVYGAGRFRRLRQTGLCQEYRDRGPKRFSRYV